MVLLDYLVQGRGPVHCTAELPGARERSCTWYSWITWCKGEVLYMVLLDYLVQGRGHVHGTADYLVQGRGPVHGTAR